MLTFPEIIAALRAHETVDSAAEALGVDAVWLGAIADSDAGRAAVAGGADDAD